MTRPTLHELLRLKQENLATSLRLGSGFAHPGAKGDVAEGDWATVIGDFLPKRYTTSSQAFVLDSDGNQSDAIDLIVHDAHYCPLLFEAGGHRYIPAESVYAVFEVKQELDREHVSYAADKAASVRKLQRVSTTIQHAGGTYPAKKRDELFTPIAGILAGRSAWKDPLGENLLKALDDSNSDGRLDFGCALEHGAFEASYEGYAATILRSEPESSLIFLLMRLFARLQNLGTVAAIDLARYAQSAELPP